MIKSRTKPATKPKKTATKPAKTSKKTKDIIVKPDDKTSKNLPALVSLPELTIENTDKSYHKYLYKTPEDMLTRINLYFQDPGNEPYHLPGLRLALRIWSTDTYKLYSQSKEGNYSNYNEIIAAAETFIEAGLIDRLFKAKNWGAVNAYLRSKFGYTEQVEHAHSHSGFIDISFTAETSDEKTKRIAHAKANEPQVIDITPQSVKDVQ